jgi:hypothetical protein
MTKLPAFLLGTLVSLACHSQHEEKRYVKNLKYRLLISSVAEVREVNSLFMVNKALVPSGNEDLALYHSPSLLSGLLIQANNASLYLVAPAPQSQSQVDREGKQSTTIFRASAIHRGLLANFNYVSNTGFYDANYLDHPEFIGDTVLFRRHNSTAIEWYSVDVNYYFGRDKFAIGLPHYFGERQLRSRFTVAMRLAYDQAGSDNGGRAYFRDSTAALSPDLATTSLSYRGALLALSPSAYLVARERFFCHVEVSAGLGVGQLLLSNERERRLRARFEVPQARIAMGINTDRFVLSMHYTYVNRSMDSGDLAISNFLSSYGLLLGFRMNQHKYRRLSWDTI